MGSPKGGQTAMQPTSKISRNPYTQPVHTYGGQRSGSKQLLLCCCCVGPCQWANIRAGCRFPHPPPPTLSQRESIFRTIAGNLAGKRDTTRNFLCSISFSSTFHVITRKFGLLFGQCTPPRLYCLIEALSAC